MTRTVKILLALTTVFAAVSFGDFPYHKQKLLDWADKYKDSSKFQDNWGKYEPARRNRECGHFVMRAIAEAAPELALFMKWKGRYNPKCNKGDMRYNDGLPTLGRAMPWLHEHCGWGLNGLRFVRTQDSDPPAQLLNFIWWNLLPGDIVGIVPWDGSDGHAGIIRDNSPNGNDFGWREHNGRNWGTEFFSGPFAWYWQNTPVGETIKLNILRPQTPATNDQVIASMALDSTWKQDYGQPVSGHGGRVRHSWICCWHENIGGTWPWFADSTGYACLSWQENSGFTTDSLISPRINLAGCNSCVLQQSCFSTLDSTVGVRKLLISTNNGPWVTICDGPPSILPSTSIPWANNQRDVRIAWFYEGPVQPGRAWCVDDFEIWATPIRNHDVAVNGIAYPCGAITQGTPIIPRAYVVNHGKQTQEMGVSMLIDGNSVGFEHFSLEAYADTLLEFGSWTGSPGIHTATCFACAQQSLDECRANDTASLVFSVVQDTWIERFPVYDGGGMRAGACITAVDSNRIYCAPAKGSTAKGYAFAKYLVAEDLWKSRKPTIWKPMAGSALSYPGTGDFIYAIQGKNHQSFCRYSISNDLWDTLRSIPGELGAGAGMACLGTDSVYVLRGTGGTGTGSKFYRYSVRQSEWQERTPTPGTIGKGGRLVCAEGSLYALRGGRTCDFYRYDPTGNSWHTLAPTPVPVYYGAAMAYDSLHGKIYTFFGSDTAFYAFNIQSGQWMKRRRAPAKVKNGGCLTYCDHSVYGGVGIGGNHSFWRYSPLGPSGFLDASDDWSELVGTAEALPSTNVHDPASRLEPGEQLTYDPTDKSTPQYSPNGLWIAYTACDSSSDGVGLYQIPALGGLPVTLVPDTLTCEDPQWANSGNWLVLAEDDGIYKVSSDTPQVKLAEGIVAGPQVTQNDSWVLYQEWDPSVQTHHVHRVRPDGTGDTCLTPGTGEYLEPQPITGSEFACARLKDEVYQLSKLVGGQETWLTSDYANNTGMDVSPNGLWLTYQKLDESGHWQIYKMRVDGTEETRITDGTCNCETPVFSPDGRYVAYTKWPIDSAEFSQVCYKDTNSAVPEVALNSATADRENPCWSPDCQHIVYEIVVESGTLGPNPRKLKQIGRARTRIKSLSGVEELSHLPRAFALEQNKPNPFGRTTTIRYALPVHSLTELSIFDVTGRAVTRLVQSEQKPGFYSVVWKGTDMRGRSVAAGTYFYVLKSNGKIAQKRMLLVR